MPGHSYKGRRSPPNITVGILPPTVFIAAGGRVGILWFLANPSLWREDSLVNGIWVHGTTATGTVRQINVAPPHGTVVSVIGLDAAGNNLTARSPSIVF